MEELVRKLNDLLDSFDLRYNYMPTGISEWSVIFCDIIVFLCALFEFQSGSVDLAFKSFCIVLLISTLYVMMKFLAQARKIISVLSRFIDNMIGASVARPEYKIGDTVSFTRNGNTENHRVTGIRFQTSPEGGGSWQFQVDNQEWLAEQDVNGLSIIR